MGNTIYKNRVFNKRPLVMLAVFFAFGVVLGRFVLSPLIYAAAAAVVAVAALCLFVLRKKHIPMLVFWRSRLMWLACAICVLLAAFLTSSILAAPYVPAGDVQMLTGRIYNEPYRNDYGSTIILIDDAAIDGQACGNVKLYVPNETAAALKCGDVIKTAADIELPRGVRNPGGFDEKLYLLADGVRYKAYADTVETIGSKGSLTVAMTQMRSYIGGVIDNIFEADIAPIAKGLLIGDIRGIDDETQTAFRDTGMAHVLSVSGLHAGILIAAVYFFFSLIRLGRTPKLLAALAFIVFYTCVTGLAPSMIRAAVMAGALLLNRHFGRQSDTLSGLALAFIAALAFNPLDLFTAGFQLSFGAVFGMLTLGWQLRRWLARRMPRKISKLGDALAASAGATAGTTPVLAASFNRVSVLSILLNLVMIPLSSAIIVLVFISTSLGMVIGTAAQYIAYVPALLIRLMMIMINAVADVSFVAVDMSSPPWYLVVACFALLFVASKYLLVRVKLKSALAALLTMTVVLAMLAAKPAGMYLVFLDVGQADAAFICTEQGGEYYIDGGRPESAGEIVSYTVRNGISPDAAFVTHTDDDHFAGLLALYQAGLLNKVYCSWQEEAAVTTAMPDACIVPLGAGDAVLLDDFTRAVVLYPYKEAATDDTNELSMVVKLEYGSHTALFAGDILGETETAVFTELGPVDIYKAAHHGSKFSSYRLPLSGLVPAYSVVSVGRNSFGHPSDWAMKNLADYSGQVLTTQDDYAVEFYISDDITMNTYNSSNE